MAPTFSGGKLKLKGSKKTKKKNKKSKHKIVKDDNVEEKKIKAIDANIDSEEDDDLTPAERKSLEMKKKREMQELEKIGGKSHRERVEEFNEKLGNLTEHNDIPRVSVIIMSFIFCLLWSVQDNIIDSLVIFIPCKIRSVQLEMDKRAGGRLLALSQII